MRSMTDMKKYAALHSDDVEHPQTVHWNLTCLPSITMTTPQPRHNHTDTTLKTNLGDVTNVLDAAVRNTGHAKATGVLAHLKRRNRKWIVRQAKEHYKNGWNEQHLLVESGLYAFRGSSGVNYECPLLCLTLFFCFSPFTSPSLFLVHAHTFSLSLSFRLFIFSRIPKPPIRTHILPALFAIYFYRLFCLIIVLPYLEDSRSLSPANGHDLLCDADGAAAHADAETVRSSINQVLGLCSCGREQWKRKYEYNKAK